MSPPPAATASAEPSAAASPAALTGPDRVKAEGKVVWCTDVAYPPMESYAADGTTPEGLDVDIAAEVAKRLGVVSRIDATGWDALLATLRAGSCDLVISSMTSTFGNRAEQADFVDYLDVPYALLLAAGNPKAITSMDDLAGKSVAVDPGLASEAALRAASDRLVAGGKPPMKIRTDLTGENAYTQLAKGEVDALMGDAVAVTYAASRPERAGKFEVGPTFDPAPIGIGVRKDDVGMKDAVAAAIAAMSADGTMNKLVAKWGLTDAVVLRQ